MTKAILYARYSTDMQSDASAEDQLRICRARAEREGWHIIAEERDQAISGTVRNRPGLNAAIKAIEEGRAHIIVAESLDRISRDQEDIAAIFKRVEFHGARIFTLSEGEIGALHIGLTGTMSALQLKQLGEKVKRGQQGRVESGRVPGGISYGYKPIREFNDDGTFERGRREIDADQAEVVRRIFTDYANNVSPVAIAKALNAEGHRSPRGGLWRASTIIGNKARRNGILNNELYRGRIIYNRQSFKKDPDSRKRQARANDMTDWQVKQVDELRIIDEALWDKVVSKLASHAGRTLAQMRRPKRLLSGKLRCGICNGTVTMVGGERWACSTARQTGTCTNKATFGNTIVEARVWTAMQQQWLHPDLIAAYVDEFQKTEAAARRLKIKSLDKIDQRLKMIEAEQERIVNAVVAGIDPTSLAARSQALSNEQAQLQKSKAKMNADDDVALHPNIAAAYRLRVSSLKQLIDDEGEGSTKAKELIRSMIDVIICTPNTDTKKAAPGTGRGKNWRAGAGINLDLRGELANILAIAKGADPQESANYQSNQENQQAGTVSLVAGVGFEPTTFRL